MKRTTAAVLAVVAAVGFGAVASMPGPPPTPSARLSMDFDVKPVEGKPGTFMVSSTITDLETNKTLASPKVMVAAGQPFKLQTGNDGKWLLEVSVAADGDSRKAAYEATFTRDGQVVSKQRFAVNLNS
jgi:hypothetical protein